MKNILVDHCTKPILWSDTTLNAHKEFEFDTVIELGFGTLSSLCSNAIPGIETMLVYQSYHK